MFGRFGYCLQTPFIATRSFVQFLFDILYPFFCFCRRTENKIQGQKTCSIRPSQCQQLKALQACSAVMVKNPGKKFHHLGSRPIIGTIVKNQNFFPLLAGKQREVVGNLGGQSQQKLTPIMARVFSATHRRHFS